MSCLPRPAATALALSLVAQTLGAQALAPAPTADALLASRLAAKGASLQEGVVLQRRVQASPGRSILRYAQHHEGVRVFGAEAVLSLEDGGRTALLADALEPKLRLDERPRLGEAEARLASHRELLPAGPYRAEPKVERIVFPTRHTGGLRPRYDAKTGPAWDRDASVLAGRARAPYVWAYEVTSHLRNAEDGFREMHVIVDAVTGDILRKWDAAPGFFPKGTKLRPRIYGALARTPLRVAAPESPARGAHHPTLTRSTASLDVLGVGHSQYNGDVALSISANPGGGYDLWDFSRGINPHPIWGTTGNVTAFYDNTYAQWGAYYNNIPYTMDNGAGSADGQWGDGTPYQAPPPDTDGEYYYPPMSGYHYGDANGQTAAVDAHFASTATYDMYKQVLGRAGLDGQDSGLFSVVHYRYWFDNAQWDTYDEMMVYGDGYYPYFPDGDRSLTSLDVGGHELSHGVMAHAANLDYVGESGALNEANSDMMAQAVMAYAQRAPGDPADRLPAVTVPWTLGAQVNPTYGPFRFMYRPSLDGVSPDAWFYGLGLLDVHYGSGVGNRMFHFLAEGASASASSDRYSPYLPQGMAGLGLDAATRIWFKAMTERFTSTTNYAGARQGCLLAATDIFGAGSPEVAAVENAFAAVNVGPAHGAAERPRVTFPEDLLDPASPLITQNSWSDIGDAFLRTPILPAGETAQLHAQIDHATNPALTWKVGIGLGFYAPNGDPLGDAAAAGSFDADGLYHAPRNAPAWCGVRAFSVQDPLEFGATMLFVARLDADGDGEQDAVDAGTLALTWNLSPSAIQQISPYPDPEGTGMVDDYSLQMWGEGFANAFIR